MSVKIRLARHGAKKAPFYRVVVADSRARRDGRFLEMVGRYNPRTTPSTVELSLDRIDYWLGAGAQPTDAVVSLIAIARGEKTVPEAKGKVSKKAVAAAKAAEEAAAKAAQDAAKAAEEAAAAEKAAAEAPAEEAPAEEPVAEDAPVEDAPVEEAPAEEAPAEEPVAEEAPAEEPAADEPAEAEE